MTTHVVMPFSGHGKSRWDERHLNHVYGLCNLLQFKHRVSYISVALITMVVLLKCYLLPTQRYLVTFRTLTLMIYIQILYLAFRGVYHQLCLLLNHYLMFSRVSSLHQCQRWFSRRIWFCHGPVQCWYHNAVSPLSASTFCLRILNMLSPWQWWVRRWSPNRSLHWHIWNNNGSCTCSAHLNLK